MKRRYFVAGMLAALWVGRYQQGSRAEDLALPNAAPEKIRLIPDQWRIRDVGRLSDGRLFFIDSQLESGGGSTRDFVCTFIFDKDGRLDEHSIESIGERGAYRDGAVGRAIRRHVAALGNRILTDIWVRPFSVDSNGTVFGLIPRKTEAGSWRVELMPGNTLSFYPPWEAGKYDT
jgi:hypothetical protein